MRYEGLSIDYCFLSTLSELDRLCMVQFLDMIAEKFYGVQRTNHLQGVFGDLFKVNILIYYLLCIDPLLSPSILLTLGIFVQIMGGE